MEKYNAERDTELSMLTNLLYGIAIGLTKLVGEFDGRQLTDSAFEKIIENGTKLPPTIYGASPDLPRLLTKYRKNPDLLRSDLEVAKSNLVSENLIGYSPINPGLFSARIGAANDNLPKNGYHFKLQKFGN